MIVRDSTYDENGELKFVLAEGESIFNYRRMMVGLAMLNEQQLFHQTGFQYRIQPQKRDGRCES